MKHHSGSLEVITGSMFSGKTDELIRRLRRATIARQKVQVFKPSIDVRFTVEKVTSHAGNDYIATPIQSSEEILTKLEKNNHFSLPLCSRKISVFEFPLKTSSAAKGSSCSFKSSNSPRVRKVGYLFEEWTLRYSF